MAHADGTVVPKIATVRPPMGQRIRLALKIALRDGAAVESDYSVNAAQNITRQVMERASLYLATCLASAAARRLR
jgi:hypothetical protein